MRTQMKQVSNHHITIKPTAYAPPPLGRVAYSTTDGRFRQESVFAAVDVTKPKRRFDKRRVTMIREIMEMDAAVIVGQGLTH